MIRVLCAPVTEMNQNSIGLRAIFQNYITKGLITFLITKTGNIELTGSDKSLRNIEFQAKAHGYKATSITEAQLTAHIYTMQLLAATEALRGRYDLSIVIQESGKSRIIAQPYLALKLKRTSLSRIESVMGLPVFNFDGQIGALISTLKKLGYSQINGLST